MSRESYLRTGFALAIATGALLLIPISKLSAQVSSTGAVNGEVTDQSGAVVPGAVITLRNDATGVSRNTSTNDVGLFNLPFLPPGNYTVTVTRQGFKTFIARDIIVRVNETVRLDVSLQVGDVAQQIAVTAHPLQVNTENANLGGVIGTKTIVDLPLNGRSFMQLGSLVPGTYAASGAGATPSITESLTGNRPGLTVEFGGTHEGSAEFLFDGVPSKQDFYGAVGITPPPDALAEFKIQTGYFSPQYGLPGVVNVVLKSGTNDFHGAAWEFLRNDVLDARNFFAFKRPPYKQNQFGGDFGGHLIRDKLFFFGDYEANRFVEENTTAVGFVPTTAMLQGDFSALSTPIYDPATYNPATGTKQPFAGNIIPPDRISDFAKKYSQFIPAPNTPPLAEFAGADLLGATRSTLDDNKFDVKVDYVRSARNRFFGRFSFLDSTQVNTSLFPGNGNQSPLTSRNGILGWTYLLGSNLVNDARVGLDRVFLSTGTPTNAGGPDWPTLLGLQNLNQIKECNAVPAVSLAKYATYGFSFANCIITGNTNKVFLDNLSWMHGRQQITLGGQLIRINFRDIASFTQNGSLSFTGQYTGNSVADYLLGDPFSVSGEKPVAPSEWRGWWPDLYINDDFHATQRLTLNLGIRWQYTQPLREQQNRQATFDFATGQLLTGHNPLTSHWADFAPRVGFAYSPHEDWAVRGSYGVFWDRLPGNEWAWENVGPPYTVGYSAVGDPNVPTIPIHGLFPTFTPNLTGSSLFALVDRSDPYVQQWTLSVQHTMPFNLLAQVAYVGIKGTHMSLRVDENTAPTPGGARPYPQYGFIAADVGAGSSRYNALELTLKKNLSHGLDFLSSYTYANGLGTNGNDWGGFESFTWTNLVFGLDALNTRHRWVTTLSYALPFGKNLKGPARFAAAGWNVDGILTFQSGFPFSVGMTTQPANIKSVFGNGYPNRVCNGNISNRTLQKWFDTSCFSVPAPNTFGNAGINYLYGPGTKNVDFAVFKNFPFAENRYVQFRSEFFNGFNNVNFGNPGATIGTPTYGVITSTQQARIIQFALKLIF
ncbi:MAG TPA: TonB-dependent receptor [Terriglobia bacterium]|jgi:hypothetical protein|nr:TonB-dependent receptor [Terriglobia bacterium]